MNKIKDYIIKDETGKHNCGGIKLLQDIRHLNTIAIHSQENTGYRLLVIQTEDIVEFWIIDHYFTKQNLNDFLKYHGYSDFPNLNFIIIDQIRRFSPVLLK